MHVGNEAREGLEAPRETGTTREYWRELELGRLWVGAAKTPLQNAI
jgi:hypothetical protein